MDIEQNEKAADAINDDYDPANVELPIINCHTHVFTGDHVPPYLAKTFLPWPLYYLLPVSLLVGMCRRWYKGIYTWQFKPRYTKITGILYRIKIFTVRSGILSLLFFILGIILSYHTFFILYDWLSGLAGTTAGVDSTVTKIRSWLSEHYLLYVPLNLAGKLCLIILLVLFFKPGRNFVWFVLKKIWSFLGVLPGPESKKLALRYLNIGRFAFYGSQADVFSRLKSQYPVGTKFVILPMDMEFMDAGKPKKNALYATQMAGLAAIKANKDYKDIVHPFVFADPRRITNQGALHFSYSFNAGHITLNDCFIKTYIEDKSFSGFKIYPALGYFPFDEALLPLWKYAADKGLPILTHCIRGTIFYRGKKKKEWDEHPVFEEITTQGKYQPMLLKEIKNRDFVNNFTHPLNYLCLLEEKLLRVLVEKAKDDKIREIFQYTDPQTPLGSNLSHLKICFGHFGGDDEWEKFQEMDRDNIASQLIKYPQTGISFLTNRAGNQTPGKPEQIWKFADWYSIICSLILQYDHVYADLSYIIHNPSIEPQLKQTLSNQKLKEKILFGTDFYVVRNHKSEKSMLGQVLSYLSKSEFDQIARINPAKFLQ